MKSSCKITSNYWSHQRRKKKVKVLKIEVFRLRKIKKKVFMKFFYFQFFQESFKESEDFLAKKSANSFVHRQS